MITARPGFVSNASKAFLAIEERTEAYRKVRDLGVYELIFNADNDEVMLVKDGEVLYSELLDG